MSARVPSSLKNNCWKEIEENLSVIIQLPLSTFYVDVSFQSEHFLVIPDLGLMKAYLGYTVKSNSSPLAAFK